MELKEKLNAAVEQTKDYVYHNEDKVVRLGASALVGIVSCGIFAIKLPFIVAGVLGTAVATATYSAAKRISELKEGQEIQGTYTEKVD